MKKTKNTIKDEFILITIKDFMDKKKLRAADICRASGLSKSALSMILSGERNTSISTLSKICVAFKISLSTFFLRLQQLELREKAEEYNNYFEHAFQILEELDTLLYTSS